MEQGQTVSPNNGTYFYIEIGRAYGQKPRLEPQKQFNKAMDQAKSISELF